DWRMISGKFAGFEIAITDGCVNRRAPQLRQITDLIDSVSKFGHGFLLAKVMPHERRRDPDQPGSRMDHLRSADLVVSYLTAQPLERCLAYLFFIKLLEP